MDFGEFLQTDFEREAKYKERIALRMAEDGLLRQAADLLAGVSMGEWRRPLGMAGVAAIAAQAGEADLARELTGRAVSELGLHGDWRRARVAAAAVAALGEQGRFDEARPMLSALEGHEDERSYAISRLCAAAARLNRADEWNQVPDGAATEKSAGLVTSEANALVSAAAWCQTRGDAERAKQLVLRARGLAEGLRAWDGSGLLAEVATQLRLANLEDDAEAMVDEAEKVALALPDGMAWKAPNLVRVADSLFGFFGDGDRARALLEVAARQPGLLQPLEREERRRRGVRLPAPGGGGRRGPAMARRRRSCAERCDASPGAEHVRDRYVPGHGQGGRCPIRAREGLLRAGPDDRGAGCGGLGEGSRPPQKILPRAVADGLPGSER